MEAAAGHRQMRRRSAPGTPRLSDPAHAEARLGHGTRAPLGQTLPVMKSL